LPGKLSGIFDRFSVTAEFVKPLAYTSPYAWIFWAVFLLCYVPESILITRSRPAPGEKTDKGSTGVIVLAGWIGMFAGFAVSGRPAFVLQRGQKIWFAAGLAILLAGTALRRHCWRMLGKHFTGNVRAAADQPVIETGAYRWVRHPSYTGGILMYLGTGLALTNWLSVIIIAGAGILAYWYRVRVEERALLNQIGPRYDDYMQRTKRFVPFIF
jgi:protein-S-isoprenylcysteine O-methyltransferase Ste14